MQLKEVKDFSGYYVNADGKVFSALYGKLKPKGTYLLKNGYESIKLFKDGKIYRKLVHRLVADAFCENENKNKEVNHKDGNKLNNNANNLEWVSHYDNMRHAFKNNLINRNKKTIVEFDGYKFTFNSIKDCAKCLGCTTPAVIYAAKNNKPLLKKYKIYHNA